MAERATGSAATPAARKTEPATPGAPGLRPRPWWMLFVVVMATNFLLMRACFPEPPSITIPYTVFRQQVEAGNVMSVTGVGDSIRGTFESEFTYPSAESADAPATPTPTPAWRAFDAGPRSSKHFQTWRPAFADPGLETLLLAKGVVIDAEDE